jgi:O-antigen/teichoic acid export membrane protein
VSKSVLGSSVGTLVLRGASFGVRVCCMLVMARKAGPELFGTISLFFTMAEVARVFADCGVDTAMLRNMATQRGEDLARSMGAAISAKLVSGSAIGAVLVAAMFLVSPATPALNLSIGLLALTPLALNLGANYFIATQRTAQITVSIVTLTLLAGTAFAVTTALSRAATPLVLVVAGYELVLGGWLVWRATRVAGIRPKLSTIGALGLVRTSLPLGVAIAVGYTYGKLDVFILDRFCARELVGQYSVWVRLLDPFLFVCGAVAITAYGHLSAAMHEGDGSRTRGIVRRYVLLNLAVSGTATVILAVPGSMLARQFLPSYADSLWIGQLLAVLLIIRSINAIFTAILQAAARRRAIMQISFVNLTVALIACTVLARWAGVLGVACGLVVMESVNFAMQVTLARRELSALAAVHGVQRA